MMTSAHKIGDAVTLNFGKGGTLTGCTIFAVRFTAGKVWYDVAVETGEKQTVIENVDSAMVPVA